MTPNPLSFKEVTDPDQKHAIGRSENERSDAALWAEILHRLPKELELSRSQIDLTVTAGVVVLEGRFDGRPARSRLIQWLHGIRGVREVCDRSWLWDSQAEVLDGEQLSATYGHLPEASPELPESARRRGEPTN